MKQPPHNTEAERCVLGAILLDNRKLDLAADMLSPGDFYHKTHQDAFRAMLSMSGDPIDLITLSERLAKPGAPTQRDSAYIAALPDTTPTAEHIESYAKVVAAAATLRRIISAAQAIAARGYEAPPAEEFANEAAAAMYEATMRATAHGPHPLSETLGRTGEALSVMAEKGGMVGETTGYAGLDAITAGWHPGELTIIAARPGEGKTTLALNLACTKALTHDVPTLFFTLEMSARAMQVKLLCSAARIDHQAIRHGEFGRDGKGLKVVWDKVLQLQAKPLWIDDTARLTTVAFQARSRRAVQEHGVQMIFVDYLQLMRGQRPRGSSREEEISSISASLKATAKELDIPVVALAQLNRKVEETASQRPQLSHLRESGAIEQDADNVMFLWRDRKEEDSKLVELIVAKQRNGPVGKTTFIFHRDCGRFEEYRG